MFIEQMIEFKLRDPGPLIVHVILKLVIFYDKTKIFNRLHASVLKATSAEAKGRVTRTAIT